MHSLRARLGAGLVASLIVVFVLQWLVVTTAMREVSERYVLTRIGHDMEALLAGLQPGAALSLDPARIGPIYQQPFSGHYFRIHAADSSIIRARSLWDQDLPAVDLPAGGRRVTELRGPQDQHLLMFSRAYTLRDEKVIISVAEDLTPLKADLADFNRSYALLSLAALGALLLVQGLIVRVGLRPLDRTRDDLKRLEAGEVAQLRDDVPREVQPLVRELNRMLAAMNERLRRSREALGNLAHALKRPLTLATQLADEPPVRGSPVREQLLGYTDTIGRLIDRELKRARLAGASSAARRFDFAEDLPPLIATLEALYRDKGLDIRTHVEAQASFAMEREDMLELLGNLLDNACKWARRVVRLTIKVDGDLRLQVEDDGPGCNADELSLLTARGVRLDENTPGHGLGLGIVRDIVSTYRGQLRFAHSEELKGLAVRVVLPPMN